MVVVTGSASTPFVVSGGDTTPFEDSGEDATPFEVGGGGTDTAVASHVSLRDVLFFPKLTDLFCEGLFPLGLKC